MLDSLQDLGKELARQRQEKGLSIAQLSNVTKISQQYIEQMENGLFDFLPDVYVKAFLRAIAKEIGLDADVMAKQFLSIKEKIEDALKTTAEEEALRDDKESTTRVQKEKKDDVILTAETGPKPLMDFDNGWRRLLNPYLLGSITIILVAIVLLLLLKEKSQMKQEIESGITIVPTESRTLYDSKTLIPIDGENVPETAHNERLSLYLRAVETAWVRIVYNDSLAEEGLFTPGDSRTWISHSNVYLKIGNAGGVRIMLNGKDLGAPGGKGRVANILISKEGIKQVTDAQFPPAMKEEQP